MTTSRIKLSTPLLAAVIDAGHGADVMSLVSRRSGTDVLFHSPWAERAHAVRGGQRSCTADPAGAWLEQYCGGWQTLCPVAGDSRLVHGAPVGFHGEASIVPWVVAAARRSSVCLHVDLFSIPLRIERLVKLHGTKIRITDTLVNQSDTPLCFDYSYHPAFGGPLLNGTCTIDTGARSFTSDPECSTTALTPGVQSCWPHQADRSGEPVDLSVVPPPGTQHELFGWLSDFSEPWVSITNAGLGLGIRLEWDAAVLPYAWVWQELNATPGFPWYRRARVVAVEPASAPTGGPDRRSALSIGPASRVVVWVALSIEDRSL